MEMEARYRILKEFQIVFQKTVQEKMKKIFYKISCLCAVTLNWQILKIS